MIRVLMRYAGILSGKDSLGRHLQLEKKGIVLIRNMKVSGLDLAVYIFRKRNSHIADFLKYMN